VGWRTTCDDVGMRDTPQRWMRCGAWLDHVIAT
jgi:hypothetical protein